MQNKAPKRGDTLINIHNNKPYTFKCGNGFVYNVVSDTSGKAYDMLSSEFYTDHDMAMKKQFQELHEAVLLQEPLKLVTETPQHRLEILVPPRRASTSSANAAVVMNARTHDRKLVVIKSAQKAEDDWKMLMEAYMHLALQTQMEHLGHRGVVPELLLVRRTTHNRICIVMEQIEHTTCFDWMVKECKLMLKRETKKWIVRDIQKRVEKMVLRVMDTLKIMQSDWDNFRFMHRDLHTANIFYDERSERVVMMDFDFSSLKMGDLYLQIPKALYTRTSEDRMCNSRSTDACIFLRNVMACLKSMDASGTGKSLMIVRNIQWYLDQYNHESKRIILRGCQQKDSQSMNAYNKISKNDEFCHEAFIKSAGNNHAVDYILGFQEYPSVTPEQIEKKWWFIR